MSAIALAPKTSQLTLNLFDGTRQPVAGNLQVLITIRNGFQEQLFRNFKTGSSIPFRLPFYDNLGDNYTVIASAGDYEDAGFTPVSLSPAAPQQLALMLLRKDAKFNFHDAQWDTVRAANPSLAALFAHGAADDAAAKTRYTNLLEDRPASLACLLNITTAMADIDLPQHTPLFYFKELIWDDTMAQDRFFGYADAELVDQVRTAVLHGTFVAVSAILHPGATSSYKQVQFGEANVQLTFHENDTRTIDGVPCVKIEPDIDYFRDPAAHLLLEVIPNAVTGGLTDPRQVYVLRWIAGQHAGVPEFNPPYTIG